MDTQTTPPPHAASILSRIHAGYFRITVSLGAQVLLWKILLQPQNNSRITIQVPKLFYIAFITTTWSFALLVLLLLTALYSLKCLLRFNAIKAEFMHHVGVNYLFAPWISWLFILEASPFVVPETAPFVILWWVFAVPVLVLDVKIYGQWFTKGKRNLTAVANPTSQLTVIGNLVGARASAKMGWREMSMFLFSLGIAHYLVLFVTLYQRLPGSDQMPVVLRPVFFLFFAAPSVASLAWYSISGRFDTAARMLFFLSLFIFASLMCRPNLFKQAMRRFNVAWWAYSYPLTMLALAAKRYEEEVSGGFQRGIRILLSALSALVVIGLLLFTVFNFKSLLPEHDPPAVDPSSNQAAPATTTDPSGVQTTPSVSSDVC